MKFLKSTVLATFLAFSLSATLVPSLPGVAQVTAAEGAEAAEKDIPGFLQDISVTIRAGFSEGSGESLSLVGTFQRRPDRKHLGQSCK